MFCFSDFSLFPDQELETNAPDSEHDEHPEHARSLVSKVVTQLLVANAGKRSSKKASELYQSRKRETPITLWNGLKLGVHRRQGAID